MTMATDGISAANPHSNFRSVSAKGVSVEFDNGKDEPFQALDRTDLEIPGGQFVALVGASGCGKTTLLNLIAGLIRPTSGTVEVDGLPAECPNPDVGYMYARDALLPWRTAQRNVELVLEGRKGYTRAQRAARAHEMLELVGLGKFTRNYRSQLSQGMRQRAAIARTLAPDPGILLMDEPFAALDARTKLSVQAEFLGIWENAPADARKTVIFVTHDLQEAVLLADRVVVMLPSPGRIASDVMVDLPRPRAEHLSDVIFDESFRTQYQALFDRLEGAMEIIDREKREASR
jgi:NitT/TauT family transport system ATP-binding protein